MHPWHGGFGHSHSSRPPRMEYSAGLKTEAGKKIPVRTKAASA